MIFEKVSGLRGPVTAFLLVIAGTGCAGRSEAPGADSTQATAAASAAPELLVQLERGPCMGRCPEYRVGLFSDGRVQYRGGPNSAVQGEQAAQVAGDAVRRLHADLVAAGAATADSAYTIGNPVCTAYIADLPTAVLSVLVSGSLKRILYDPGCQGAPSYLADFATRLDSLAGTAPWVRGPSEKAP